jgi:hypothetical protein
VSWVVEWTPVATESMVAYRLRNHVATSKSIYLQWFQKIYPPSLEK